MKPRKPWRLITIRISHFNEKARWALDRCGHAYDEEPYLPLFHFVGAVPVLLPRRLGRRDHGSTRFSTPILVAGDEVVTDSAAIVRFASDQAADRSLDLHFSPEAAQLEESFNRFGEHTRRLAYWYLLPDSESLIETAERGVSKAQVRLFRPAIPLARKMLRRVLRVDEAQAMRSRDHILSQFESVGARLADGRPYLLGDRFSAADLAFAALASVALDVQAEEGYGAWLPPLDRLDPEFAALARELRDTPAGRFTLRMFAEERGQRLRPCVV